MIESKKRTHVELLDSLIKQRTSITALNSDSHSSRFIVQSNRRNDNETTRSCGIHPRLKSAAFSVHFQPRFSPLPDAGILPAFSLRARRRLPAVARGAEFISVSGLRIDRSALCSDMRPSKRTSGVAAATTRPHAPMNSPTRTDPGHLGFTLHHSSIDA
jgi:hypothetical protein